MTGSPSVVVRRVDRISLRLVAPDDTTSDEAALDRPMIVDLEARTDGPLARLGERLAERLARIHESYTQTTFYLFDPESWR